ncbi:MAG: molybdopterin-dependent oxidoreductase, partial [Actinomycetota bacterium]
MADNGPVNITINGKEISAPRGRLLIDVAEEHDFFVPRFCYHPGLESVAACRMCLVEIEGSRRSLDPACSTPIADGMVVRTDSPSAVDAQEAVLELLLINHPLDCPICDRGGECPLQDQALRFGPGSSRYRDEKRHFPKPIPISDLVMLDRERCVLCWRCVRFCEEVSGDSFIDLMDRGSLTQINIAEDAPFDSYFSGNTIQICPVGALTSKPYRFLSRPWDIIPTETTCSFCAVGCPISLESRGGEVLRAQALPNEEVNSFWNCDKGRFGHRYVSHPDRLKAPLIRRNSASGDAEFAEQNWDDVLDLIAERIRSTLSESGPRSVGFIGGSHATNEDLFAASRFFREVIGTPNLDFRTFDADFPYEELAVDGIAGSNATLTDLEKARAILWVGPDPKEELPVLYLRLRKAALAGVKLVIVSSRCTSLDRLGIFLSAAPGGEGPLLDDLARGSSSYEGNLGALEEAQQALSEGPIVICVGPQFVGRPASHLVPHLRSLIATLPDAKLFLCPPNANSQGALDMGISPYLTPGHREGPEGLGTRQMLEAAAQGDLRLLWVMGADLV